MSFVENESPRRRRRWGVWLIAACILALCLAGGAYWGYTSFLPPVPGASPAAVDVIVTRGESTSELARDLQQKGLIRNAFLFRLYLSYEKKGPQIQAGHYRFNEGTNIPEIVNLLTHGDVVQDMVKVTIPEGYTVLQIASVLSQSSVCSEASFIQEVQHGVFDVPFVKGLPTPPKVKYRLEGYLFPDTYDFSKGESAHDVILTMLTAFQNHVTPDVLTQIQSLGMTLPQVVTEASMVEKEAKVNAERPTIASVMNNRLKNGMKLQIDATVEYVVGHKDVLSTQDLAVSDPYNTYANTGLPPGPISNPGWASIVAVLHPAHTNYIYYVAKYDGTGEHFFASTYAEQLHNEALSQANYRKLTKK